MISRIQLKHPHQAFLLLKNCFSIPKLQYISLTSPTFKDHLSLEYFDEKLRNSQASLLNFHLKEFSWTQDTLPVSVGGIGIRKTVDTSLPAFSYKSYSMRLLIDAVSQNTTRLAPAKNAEFEEAFEKWTEKSVPERIPEESDECKKKAWSLGITEV